MTTLPIQIESNYRGIHAVDSRQEIWTPKGYLPLNAPVANPLCYDVKKIRKATLFLIGEIAVVYLAVRFGHSRGWDKGWDDGYAAGWDKAKDWSEQKCKRELDHASVRSLFEKLGIYAQFFVDALRR